MNVCIVQPNRSTPSETFLHAHADRLPGNVTVLHGVRPHISGQTIGPLKRISREWVKLRRWLKRMPSQWEVTELFTRAFRSLQPDVVIAEYGVTGVKVMDACRKVGVPLIVYFRGYDAADRQTLAVNRDAYRRLFEQAVAVVAVSQPIRATLHSLGADPEKLHYNPSGVDCDRFHGAEPQRRPPVFLAVGRLVEKKAPHLTILAFAELRRTCPSARLRIIGEGDMLPFCRELVHQLRLNESVDFVGSQPHEVVAREMRQARAFVQHSVTARGGDSEGTPNTIMEAGASGLPVVATRHGGIPDVVLHEQTGLLVDEHDVFGMATQLRRLVNDADLAARLGVAASSRIRQHFSQQQSIARLWSIVSRVTGKSDYLEEATISDGTKAA